MMKKKEIAERIMIELSAVMEALQSPIHYPQNLRYVLIHKYPLPAGFNYVYTSVLIFLPGLYPLLPPTGFAIAISDDLTKNGVPLRSLAKGEWLYFPLGYEQQPWRATYNLMNSDNLLTVCNRIYEILQRFEPR
jgi:hypothetical protein